MPKTTQPAPEPPIVGGPRPAPIILAAIIQEVGAITKNRKNEQQGFAFRGIDDIYNTLHPLFASHGMTCIPCVQSIERSIHQNAKKNNVFGSIVKIAYRFTSPDGSYVEATAIGEGFDFADKATAKALSMAQKYLFIQTFLIPTKDVADADNDTTIDPREELKELARQKEEEAKAQVKSYASGGAQPDLPADRAEALERQREELQRQIDEREGKLAPGQTAVQETAPAPMEQQKAPEKPAKVAKTPTKPTAPTPPEKPSQQAPAPQEEPEELTAGPANTPACYDHTITALNHKAYHGKKLGALSAKELNTLKVNWADRFAADIKGNPALEELRDNLLQTIAARQSEAA